MLKVKTKGMYGSYLQLKETKQNLQNNIETLEKVEKELREQSETEEIRRSIHKVIESLEQEVKRIYKLMLVLERAMSIYVKTEKNIQEKYEGGMVTYKRYRIVNTKLKRIDAVLTNLKVK